jgi:hypothetical protein
MFADMLAYKFLNAEFGLKSLRERRLKISAIEDLNDPFELMPFEMTDRLRRKAFNILKKNLNQGLVCFSSEWKDPVIWAHYSDKHRGLCLGFEIPKKHCKEITYVSRRLPCPETIDLSHAQTTIFTKYINWSYEKEIRVWAEIKEEEGGLFYKPFDRQLKLVEVIAGARCNLRRSQIVDVLGGLATQVRIIKARAGFRRFEIVENRQGFNRKNR